MGNILSSVLSDPAARDSAAAPSVMANVGQEFQPWGPGLDQ